MSFGIQKVGDPKTFISWSHWTREDAQQAAEYNSARWGEYEVWTDVTRSQLTGDQFEFIDDWHESQEAGCCDIDGPYCADSIADLLANERPRPDYGDAAQQNPCECGHSQTPHLMTDDDHCARTGCTCPGYARVSS